MNPEQQSKLAMKCNPTEQPKENNTKTTMATNTNPTKAAKEKRVKKLNMLLEIIKEKKGYSPNDLADFVDSDKVTLQELQESCDKNNLKIRLIFTFKGQ